MVHEAKAFTDTVDEDAAVVGMGQEARVDQGWKRRGFSGGNSHRTPRQRREHADADVEVVFAFLEFEGQGEVGLGRISRTVGRLDSIDRP